MMMMMMTIDNEDTLSDPTCKKQHCVGWLVEMDDSNGIINPPPRLCHASPSHSGLSPSAPAGSTGPGSNVAESNAGRCGVPQTAPWRSEGFLRGGFFSSRSPFCDASNTVILDDSHYIHPYQGRWSFLETAKTRFFKGWYKLPGWCQISTFQGFFLNSWETSIFVWSFFLVFLPLGGSRCVVMRSRA